MKLYSSFRAQHVQALVVFVVKPVIHSHVEIFMHLIIEICICTDQVYALLEAPLNDRLALKRIWIDGITDEPFDTSFVNVRTSTADTTSTVFDDVKSEKDESDDIIIAETAEHAEVIRVRRISSHIEASPLPVSTTEGQPESCMNVRVCLVVTCF